MNSKMVSMLVLQKGSVFSSINRYSYIHRINRPQIWIHFVINYFSVEYHLKAYHNYEHTLAKRPVKI